MAGNEGAAVVAAAGPNAKGVKEGDVVIPAKPGFGTWRTHAVVESEDVIKMPAGLSAMDAATLSVNPCTALRMLSDFASLSKGDVVVQNGANSMVGQAVIQIARARGVRTVNIIRERPGQQHMIEHLKKIGGDVVVPLGHLQTSAGRELVSDLPPAKLGLNCVGGPSGVEVARLLGDGASMVTYGAMARTPVSAPVGPMIFRDISLRGF